MWHRESEKEMCACSLTFYIAKLSINKHLWYIFTRRYMSFPLVKWHFTGLQKETVCDKMMHKYVIRVGWQVTLARVERMNSKSKRILRRTKCTQNLTLNTSCQCANVECAITSATLQKKLPASVCVCFAVSLILSIYFRTTIW